MGVDWITNHSKNKDEYNNTAELQKMSMNMVHVVNSAGICLFAYLSYPVQFIPDFLTAITGVEYTIGSCLKIGERIANMRHLFNLREGLNPLNYFFNPRALGRPPLKRGPIANITIDDSSMLIDYLKTMDWDLSTTQPSSKKLKELNLQKLLE